MNRHYLDWAGDGAAHFRGLMARMGDDAFAAPSALPGWSRAHVLTHVARNAEALTNLLDWARTGVETPMYPSREARAAAIEEGAKREPDVIRGDVVASSDRLADVVREQPKAAWSATVRTMTGAEIAAPRILWMRALEMWLHAVDLDVGAALADLPGPMLTTLLDEARTVMGAKPECPALRLVAPEGTWEIGGPDGAVTVTGPAPELAAWLTGRSRGKHLRADGSRTLPELPPWG